MKLPNWFNWQNRKTQKQEILSQIDDTIKKTEHANRVADRVIAALDGETGWFECKFWPNPTRNKNGTINSTSDHKYSV